MELLFCLISIIILVLTGYLFITLVRPEHLFAQNNLILNYCVALGLGFGITSVVCFIGMQFSNRNSTGLMECIFCLILLGCRLVVFRINEIRTVSAVFDKSQETNKFTLFIFYSIITIIILRLIIRTFESPHGHFDARFIWNLRARFIFRGWDNWRNAFDVTLNWTHNDYPLLLSLSVVRIWNYIGKDTIVAPAVIAFLFTSATVALTYSSLSVLRNQTQGILAACILVGPTFYVEHGSSQTADIPIGFYFLLTIVLAVLYDAATMKNRSLLFLAGMTAGFAAWTKNEGLLFLLIFITTRCVLFFTQERRKDILKDVLSIFFGALPVLALLIYFKSAIAPPNDLLHSGGLLMATMKLSDPARYAEVVKAIIAQLHFKGAFFAALLALYLGVVKINIPVHEKRAIYLTAIILFLMVTGYFLVYVITPWDLAWHVGNSVDRLTLQLWPSMVFLFFIIASQHDSEYFAQIRGKSA